MLIVGKSGSGKSTLARSIIRLMQGRYRHLIIINRKREFAELAQGRYTVGEDGNPWPALKKHRRVIFQVTGYDSRPFLDNLGQAVMQLQDVLLVVDEAHHFFPRGQTPKGLFEVLTGGREHGHSTQQNRFWSWCAALHAYQVGPGAYQRGSRNNSYVDKIIRWANGYTDLRT